MAKNKKSSKKAKSNKVELNTLSLKAILPYVIIASFVVIIGIAMINGLSMQKGLVVETKDPWKEAYAKVESSKVGIVFNDVNTSEDEYTKLRRACNEYIEQAGKDSVPDAKLNVETVVKEQKFIDGASNVTANPQDDKNKLMVETGPLYFQDKLLLRYINDSGELKIVTAVFEDGQKEKVKVLKQSELLDYVNSKSATTNVAKQTVAKDSTAVVQKQSISEEEYVYGVGDTIVKMLKASSTDEVNEAERSAIQYFTIEGKQTVFDGKNSIKIDKNSTVAINYAVAGKSDTNMTTKDRIYMQLKVNNGAGESLVNIIIKLNSNYRIFDIDIV